MKLSLFGTLWNSKKIQDFFKKQSLVLFHVLFNLTYYYLLFKKKIFILYLIMNRLEVLRESIKGSVFDKTYTKIQIQRQGKISVIWLNSLKQLNSLSPQMTHQIKEALLSLDHDNQIKVIVLRSKHEKVFCAGADIKHMKENDYATYPFSQHFISVVKVMRSIKKPIISIVQGKALGGGFELALLADIIIANKNAAFALPEINLGLIPGMGGTQILTRIVGTKVATRMILTGQPINAEEAHRLKVADYYIPEDFQKKLNSLLTKLASKSTQALTSCKRAIGFSQQSTLNQGLQHETTIFQRLMTKQAPKQGVKAFIEQRRPNFDNL